MILPIIQWPDPSLRRVSEPVPPDTDVSDFVKDLFDTMYAADGAGLSAIQVGTTWQIFVAEAGGKEMVFINPVIKKLLGEPTIMREGCLSLPNVFEDVLRHQLVEVEFGQHARVMATFSGLMAHVIQHEVDHFDGVLFVDKLSPFKRERILKKLEKKRAR